MLRMGGREGAEDDKAVAAAVDVVVQADRVSEARAAPQ